MRGDSIKFNAALIQQNVKKRNHDNLQLALEEVSLFCAELLAESSNGFGRHTGPLYEEYQGKDYRAPPILTKSEQHDNAT